jgi:hypothetical protein
MGLGRVLTGLSRLQPVPLLSAPFHRHRELGCRDLAERAVRDIYRCSSDARFHRQVGPGTGFCGSEKHLNGST